MYAVNQSCPKLCHKSVIDEVQSKNYKALLGDGIIIFACLIIGGLGVTGVLPVGFALFIPGSVLIAGPDLVVFLIKRRSETIVHSTKQDDEIPRVYVINEAFKNEFGISPDDIQDYKGTMIRFSVEIEKNNKLLIKKVNGTEGIGVGNFSVGVLLCKAENEISLTISHFLRKEGKNFISATDLEEKHIKKAFYEKYHDYDLSVPL